MPGPGPLGEVCMLAEAEMETFGRKPVLMVANQRQQFKDVRPFLRHQYDLTVTDEGWEALDLAEKSNFFLIVVDSKVAGMGGYNLAQKMRLQGKNRESGLILIAHGELDQADHALSEGICDDFLMAPFDISGFLSKFWKMSDLLTEKSWDDLPNHQRVFLKNTKENFNQIARDLSQDGRYRAETVNAAKSEVVQAAVNGTALELLDLLWNYHQHTYVHSVRSCALMSLMGVELGFSMDELGILSEGGLLHDLGKIQMPKSILNKPDRLNDQEKELMREHPLWSARFIRDSQGLREEAARVAERHHERIDGSGYPYGLRGAEIDELSLVTAIADVFAAVTETVPYRAGLDFNSALEVMDQMRGDKLEPGLCDAFCNMVREKLIKAEN